MDFQVLEGCLKGHGNMFSSEQGDMLIQTMLVISMISGLQHDMYLLLQKDWSRVQNINRSRQRSLMGYMIGKRIRSWARSILVAL